MSNPYTVHDHKHIIFTDGRDVIHQISNEFGQQTDSGQPFMVSSNDLATLINMFYETTSIDDEGNVIGLIPYPIKWNARFDDESRAQLACYLLNAASGGAVQMRYIKHPNRNEWATPYQQVIFNSLPDSEIKTQMQAWAAASEAAGYVLTRVQMETEGWF
jgi:hypothetical protein